MEYGFGVVKHDQHYMWHQATASDRQAYWQVYGGLSGRRYKDATGKMGLCIDMILGHCNLQEQHYFTSARYARCWRCIN